MARAVALQAQARRFHRCEILLGKVRPWMVYTYMLYCMPHRVISHEVLLGKGGAAHAMSISFQGCIMPHRVITSDVHERLTQERQVPSGHDGSPAIHARPLSVARNRITENSE
jgi:hypothetical protein